MKIIINKLEYHKTIIDIPKEKKVEFHTYRPQQQQHAYRAVIRNLHHSLQQELVRENIERIGNKIRNIWNIRQRVTDNSLSLFILAIEQTTNNKEIYHIEYLQNVRVQIQPQHQSKIIYHNARDAKRTSTQRGTAHTDQDA
jgi:hypothetical protein